MLRHFFAITCIFIGSIDSRIEHRAHSLYIVYIIVGSSANPSALTRFLYLYVYIHLQFSIMWLHSYLYAIVIIVFLMKTRPAHEKRAPIHPFHRPLVPRDILSRLSASHIVSVSLFFKIIFSPSPEYSNHSHRVYVMKKKKIVYMWIRVKNESSEKKNNLVVESIRDYLQRQTPGSIFVRLFFVPFCFWFVAHAIFHDLFFCRYLYDTQIHINLFIFVLPRFRYVIVRIFFLSCL